MASMSKSWRTLIRAACATIAVGLVIAGTMLPAHAGSPPNFTGFSPNSGPVGTIVTITGTNFGGTTAVKFNATSATTFNVNGSGTAITATVPNGATTGPISVTTPNGTGQTSGIFTVTGTSSPPKLMNFTPRQGPVGTQVTITGSNFQPVNSVKFNGTGAAFTVNSAGTQIVATVPAGATTGKISVSGPSGSDQSLGNFTVTTSTAPSISNFSPRSGRVGAAVSIFGSGFNGTTAVRFNGTSATPFTVVSNTKITTTVPTGATTGRISVTNPAGTAQSGGDFTVLVPKITSFSPTSGPVGTSVTLQGSNFTGVTSVKFHGTAASFSFIGDGRVTTVVPSGATTGPISLTTPSGTATTTNNFTVTGGTHARNLSLSLHRRRHLFAVGSVSVNDGYVACRQHVPVVIKRFHRGVWRWITTTSTSKDGTYKTFLPDRSGLYRAKAIRIQLVNGAFCGGARSNVVRHHR